MDKQNEIDRMAQAIGYGCLDPLEVGCKGMPCAVCIASDLHKKGYRKADEVRRETAKTVLTLIKDLDICLKRQHIEMCLGDIENAMRNYYGVEVEE